MERPMALIVEEDPERAMLLSQAAESAGFASVIAGDGWTALIKLARLLPALVVLKPLLPVVSGAEIAAHIRGDGRWLGTQILMISGEPISGRARELADAVLDHAAGAGDAQTVLKRLRQAVHTRQTRLAPPGSTVFPSAAPLV